MPEGKIVQAVFPEELIRQLDEYSASLEKAYPGIRVSRSGTLRMLVEQALRNTEKGV